ncbi:hypothetical protein IJ182_00945 [bacterium]|nr:hypothetical protein [bacterium]
MINTVNTPTRYQYIVKTEEKKTNNKPLTNNDYLNVGFLAGRFGINLKNPNEPNYVYKDNNGTYVNINSCCASLFEDTLKESGIKFDRLA